jgi:hypothetical protein
MTEEWPPTPALLTDRAALERAGGIKLDARALLNIDLQAQLLAGLPEAYAEWRGEGVRHRQALKLGFQSEAEEDVPDEHEERRPLSASRRHAIRTIYYWWKRRRGRGGRVYYHPEEKEPRGTFRTFFREICRQAGLLEKNGKPKPGLSDGNIRACLERTTQKGKGPRRKGKQTPA